MAEAFALMYGKKDTENDFLLSPLLDNLRPYPAEAFGRNAQIGGNHPLRNAHHEFGVGLDEIQIALFGRGALELRYPILQVHDVAVEQFVVELEECAVLHGKCGQ